MQQVPVFMAALLNFNPQKIPQERLDMLWKVGLLRERPIVFSEKIVDRATHEGGARWHEDFTVEDVRRQSTAAANLVQWVRAVVEYARMYDV